MIIRANKGSSLWDFDVFNTSELAFWMSLSPTATRTSTISYGTNISGVTDVSGNARNLSQSTDTAQPVYQATGFNGLPTIAFDGSNDSLSFSVPQAYNQAIIAVINTASIGTGDRIFLGRSFSGGEPGLYLGAAIGNYRPSIYWSIGYFALQPTAIQTRALFFWQLGGNATGFTRTNVNANSLVSQANAQSAISSWSAINASIQSSNIQLSELVILNNPSQDSIDRAHGILAHRWWRLAGQPVPLSSGHPYFSTPPTR